MTAMPVAERMTAEEFLARPYGSQHRWERLIDGEIVNDSPLLVLGHHDVYEPDVHWHRAERAPIPDAEPPYPIPDLVVEVRSPRTWVYDIGRKQACSPLLPGFALPLANVFGE